jgi:hypothetical protein
MGFSPCKFINTTILHFMRVRVMVFNTTFNNYIMVVRYIGNISCYTYIFCISIILFISIYGVHVLISPPIWKPHQWCNG